MKTKKIETLNRLTEVKEMLEELMEKNANFEFVLSFSVLDVEDEMLDEVDEHTPSTCGTVIYANDEDSFMNLMKSTVIVFYDAMDDEEENLVWNEFESDEEEDYMDELIRHAFKNGNIDPTIN